jgi:hypothetical protein
MPTALENLADALPATFAYKPSTASPKTVPSASAPSTSQSCSHSPASPSFAAAATLKRQTA